MTASRLFLRRRRAVRTIWILFFAAVLFSHFGPPTDDWATFNQRPFTVVAAGDDGSILLRSSDGSIDQIVRLLGVDSPSSTYLRSRLVGKTVTLLLDSPQTRDSQRRLLAYVFVSDADNFNVDIVRDGFAYADRKQNCLLSQEIRSAQVDARKKGRGS